jgi:hypothetical protein
MAVNKSVLFGKTVKIKQFGCSSLNIPAPKIPPSANIFVKVTNGCNWLFRSNGASLFGQTVPL